MAITSYSQRYEDARLWRALCGVESGFYIDVGAAYPKYESVTQLFYERNWRGINIEPTASRYAALIRERQRDINLRVLVGSKDGTTTFYSVGLGNGLSTTRKDFADSYREKGLIVEVFEEECTSLNSIWARHVTGPVHFLKIDVEGAEKEVLEGCDFLLHRPWVVVIEATLPDMSTPTHDDWQAILDAADYRFVVFDGLNRFYVAQEHFADISPALGEPIRPEDGFVQWNGQ